MGSCHRATRITTAGRHAVAFSVERGGPYGNSLPRLQQQPRELPVRDVFPVRLTPEPPSRAAAYSSDTRQNNNALPNDALANAMLEEKNKNEKKSPYCASAIAESPINDRRCVYCRARFTPKHVNSAFRLSTFAFLAFRGFNLGRLGEKTVNTKAERDCTHSSKRRAKSPAIPWHI